MLPCQPLFGIRWAITSVVRQLATRCLILGWVFGDQISNEDIAILCQSTILCCKHDKAESLVETSGGIHHQPQIPDRATLFKQWNQRPRDVAMATNFGTPLAANGL